MYLLPVSILLLTRTAKCFKNAVILFYIRGLQEGSWKAPFWKGRPTKCVHAVTYSTLCSITFERCI